MNKKPYKILITGGTGFLGKSLIQKFLSENTLKSNPLVIDLISRQSVVNPAKFFFIPEKKNIIINFHKINIICKLPSSNGYYLITIFKIR